LPRTLLRNPFEQASDASPRQQGARATPVCSRCRSDDVTCTATVQWSNEQQEWQLANTFGLPVHCNTCNGPSDLTWLPLN
jgi:hypothetical protein